MNNKFLRLPEVTNLTGYSRSSIYSKMSEGTFPKSIKLGPRAIGWLQRDIEAWMYTRVTESLSGHNI